MEQDWERPFPECLWKWWGEKISLESEEGQGVTFWVDLVFRKQPLPDEPQSKHQVIFQELKILIVDDNTNNRFILREYLNPWECHIADAEPAGKLVTQHTIKEKHTGQVVILLAEDYPTNQQIAMSHLRSAGYAVDLAENGEQAVQAFMGKSYDLILMDVQMPVMEQNNDFEIQDIMDYDAALLEFGDDRDFILKQSDRSGQ